MPSTDPAQQGGPSGASTGDRGFSWDVLDTGVNIGDDGVPLFGFGKAAAWSVANLALVMVAVLAALVAVLFLAKGTVVGKLLAMVPAAAMAVAFAFTENVQAAMAAIDWCTPWMAAGLAVELAACALSAVLAGRKRRRAAARPDDGPDSDDEPGYEDEDEGEE